ncbi:unnamed protein product [Sphagnum compactum]
MSNMVTNWFERTGNKPLSTKESKILKCSNFIIPCNDADEVLDQEEKTTIQGFAHLEPGPQVPLKEQLEKDKEDESLRRWKEQLLGYGASLDTNGDRFHSDHPEVKVSRLGISAKGREELELPLPLTTTTNTPQGHPFSLKEASHYQLKFIFTVRNNIVSVSLASLQCGKLASWSKRCSPCLGPLLRNRSLMFTFWQSS